MLLEIKLGQSEVELKILKNRRALDFETAKYYHDLSDVLITTLDKLLKRNKLDPIRLLSNNVVKRSRKDKSNGVNPKSLKSYKIQSDLGQDSTSYKIAAAFIEGLKVSC